jgi:biotin transport system substrate-specific component
MPSVQQVQSVDGQAGVRWSERPLLQMTIGVVAFAAMTALGAEVRIPLPGTPVPVTLQTLFVLLAGAALGPLWGGTSQALYLILRTAGVAGFAAPGAGLAVLGGPTAGYLVGFVLAASVTGWLTDRGPRRNLAWLLFSMVIGTILVYICGMAWLVWGCRLPVPVAFLQGIFPFLLGDLLKVMAAAGLARMAGKNSGI